MAEEFLETLKENRESFTFVHEQASRVAPRLFWYAIEQLCMEGDLELFAVFTATGDLDGTLRIESCPYEQTSGDRFMTVEDFDLYTYVISMFAQQKGLKVNRKILLQCAVASKTPQIVDHVLGIMDSEGGYFCDDITVGAIGKLNLEQLVIDDRLDMIRPLCLRAEQRIPASVIEGAPLVQAAALGRAGILSFFLSLRGTHGVPLIDPSRDANAALWSAVKADRDSAVNLLLHNRGVVDALLGKGRGKMPARRGAPVTVAERGHALMIMSAAACETDARRRADDIKAWK